MDPDWSLNQFYHGHQSGNWDFDNGYPFNGQLPDFEYSSENTQFPSGLSSQTPPQLNPGNGPTNAEPTMFAEFSQPPPPANHLTEQSHHLAPAPCAGCTRRMAKVETRDAIEKTKPCHFQSSRKTKKCMSCRGGHRRCEWIEDPEIQRLAKAVQSAFQRLKEKGGRYTKEEENLSRRVLFQLDRKYPCSGGSRVIR